LGQKPKERLDPATPTRRRKRKLDMVGDQKDGSTFLKTHNEQETQGKWTNVENFLFVQHIIMDPHLLQTCFNNQ
jgi:hypothetical protein